MVKREQNWNHLLSIIFIGLAAITVFALPSSLDQAALHRGVDVRLPDELVESNPDFAVVGLTSLGEETGSLYRTASRTFFWVFVPLILIIYMVSPGDRKKKLLYLTIALALIILVPMIVQSLLQGIDPKPLKEEGVILPTPPPGVELAQPVVDSSPVPPIIGIIFSALVIIPIVIYLSILYNRHGHTDPDSLIIQQKTNQAISALQEGQSMENVIVRLYKDMCGFINQKRGVQRKSHMTPREFQLNLNAIGVPEDASKTLTRFFEAARYGNSPFDETDHTQAIQCLTIIKESVNSVENSEPAI